MSEPKVEYHKFLVDIINKKGIRFFEVTTQERSCLDSSIELSYRSDGELIAVAFWVTGPHNAPTITVLEFLAILSEYKDKEQNGRQNKEKPGQI